MTPEVVGVGSLEDGWAYLVTRFLPGRRIGWAFQDLPEDARVALARRQGELAAELRSLGVPLERRAQLTCDWRALLREQRVKLV